MCKKVIIASVLSVLLVIVIYNKSRVERFTANEYLNKFILSYFNIAIWKIWDKISIETIIVVSNIPHLLFTPNEIPIVINPKKITNSRGFLTGFLNLTIDNAPIIPRESAKLFDIIFVITNAIGGSIKNVIK